MPDSRLIRGLSLQTYTVPGMPEVQKRLYMVTGEGKWTNQAEKNTMWRVSLNHLETMDMGKLEKTVTSLGISDIHTARKAAWSKVTKVVRPPQYPSDSISRLAYAAGKLYYMFAMPGDRFVLQSTDVTVSIDCSDLMKHLSPLIQKWPAGEIGKTYEVPPFVPHTEHA